MGYQSNVIHGLSWGTSFDVLSKLMSLGKISLLSHFIFGPTEFGIFGVAVLVLGFLELFTESGINVLLVQKREDVKEYIDTAFVISIMRGVLMAVVLVVIAYPVATFFNTPEAARVILAIALVPFLRGFINPAIVNLQKDLKFRQDAFYRFIVDFSIDVFTVIFAFLTHSVFSFVLGMIAGVIIEIIITFWWGRPRPRFAIDRPKFREIWSRGRWVSAAYLLDYFFQHGDDFAVGKLLNAFSLGIYQNAYALSIFPQTAVSYRLERITLPVYVKISDDRARVRRAFNKTFLIVTAGATVFGIALFFLSDPLVRIVLGEKWLSAIPLLRVLAFFGVVRAVTSLFRPLFLAYKQQQYVTYVSLASIVGLAITVVPLTQNYGIVGAGMSAVIGSIAAIPVSFYYLNRILNSK